MAVKPIGQDFVPYASANSVTKVLRQFRERGLPDPITAAGLEQIGLPPSMTSFTLRALVFLGLIDEAGNLMEDFRRIRRATTDEYPGVLAKIIRKAYLRVFTVADPAIDDEGKVTDAFRIFEPTKQRDKMVALFMGLCEEAGIIPPGKSKRRASTGGRAPSRRSPANVPEPPKPPEQTSSLTPPPASQTTLPAGLHHVIAPLIRDLAETGNTWTKVQRDSWKKTFDSLLDYAYPAKDGQTDSV